jgi:all-trans-retinol 13,14-reductase
MQFDTIVIGSGISGLSCAGFLSFCGQKVLVLESEKCLGGCMQPISHGQWSWNLGLQWICKYGATDPDGFLLRMLTDNKIKLNKLDDEFMQMTFPELDNFKFTVRTNMDLMENALIEQFPAEENSIKKYYSLVRDINLKLLALPAAKLFSQKNAQRYYTRLLKIIFPILSKTLEPLTETSLADVVGKHLKIKDEQLKAILYSYWHFIGFSPQQIPFLFYAVVVGLQENGVYYPAGGSSSIINLLKQRIEHSGGQLITDSEAASIIIENGNAVGVQTESDRYYAKNVVSSIGIRETIERLVPGEFWNDAIKKTMSMISTTLKVSPSILILRVGLKGDMTSFGIKKGTYRMIKNDPWDFKSDPTSKTWEPADITINFPSFYDTGSLSDGYHTAEVVHLTKESWFEGFDPDSEAFNQIKAQITQKLLSWLYKFFPGIDTCIQFTMLTTPFDVGSQTHHFKSSIYGLDITKASNMQLQTHSGIPNLFFTGEDIFAQGITLTNGLLTASSVLETDLIKKWFPN